MNFSLTEDQQKQLSVWDAEQSRIVMEKQKDNPNIPDWLKEQPYYGAIGGALTYSFTPNSLGMVVKVQHGGTGNEIDLTDYEW